MDPKIGDRVAAEIDREFARTEYPDGFPELPPIPPKRYTDSAFFELEKENVFRRSWLPVGEEIDFPKVGSYKLFDRLGPPILIIRGEDRRLRAFYNTCQHRGAPVVRIGQDVGSAQRLRCQYHSWTYDLQGNLVAVPEERDFHPCLDKRERSLNPVRCETFRGIVFINEDPDAPSLRDWLGPIWDEVPWRTDLRGCKTRSTVINCNWKICLEAFIEVYHFTTVHPTTAAPTGDMHGTASEFMPNGHSRMVVPSTPFGVKEIKRIRGELGPGAADHEVLHRVNWTYTFFPSMLAPGGPGGFSLLTFWPVDVGTTLFETQQFVPDWGDGPIPEQYQREGIGQLMEEDIENMEPIQQSLLSSTYIGPRVSYHERRIYYFNESIDKMIGPDRIPEELRIEQLLEEYIVK